MHSHLPSRTAIVVALGCLCTLKLARPGFWDERVTQLLRASLGSASFTYRTLEVLSRTRTGSRLLNALVSAVIPGMFSHYVARKVLIEKWVRQELSNKTNKKQRLLVIGGGLDTLAMRVAADYPLISVEEWDHPSTQKFKTQALASELSALSNLRYYSTDLNETDDLLWQRLANDSETSTIVVVEGVLMYLKEEGVRNVLCKISAICEPDGSCVLSFMEVDASGRVGFCKSRKGFVDGWLARRQEPFLWGIDPGAASDWLAKQGWQIRSFSSNLEMISMIEGAGSTLERPAAGEHVVQVGLTSLRSV